MKHEEAGGVRVLVYSTCKKCRVSESTAQVTPFPGGPVFLAQTKAPLFRKQIPSRPGHTPAFVCRRIRLDSRNVTLGSRG